MNPEQLPLRSLHLPEAVGWWPLAPGWWLVLGLCAVGLVMLLRAAWRRRRRNAARRFALEELARLQHDYQADGNAVALGVRLSELLRRVMLAYAPRSEVAGLTGRAWLDWLDRGLDDKPFTEGPGRELKDLPYRNAAGGMSDVDVDGLIEVIRRRLQTPLPESA